MHNVYGKMKLIMFEHGVVIILEHYVLLEDLILHLFVQMILMETHYHQFNVHVVLMDMVVTIDVDCSATFYHFQQIKTQTH